MDIIGAFNQISNFKIMVNKLSSQIREFVSAAAISWLLVDHDFKIYLLNVIITNQECKSIVVLWMIWSYIIDMYDFILSFCSQHAFGA